MYQPRLLFLKHFLLVTLLLMGQGAVLNATEKVNLVTKDANAIIKTYSDIQGEPNRTLVVFDIDNTLLRNSSDFGSEHWFLWQKQMIEASIFTLPTITNSVDDLLTLQTEIYDSDCMSLVDSRWQGWIAKLRSRQTHVIALTSRVLPTMKATHRELLRNGISLSSNRDLFLRESGEPYLPYDLGNLDAGQLSVAEVQKYGLGPAKEVWFKDGILMSQGQHKGIMLKLFLAKVKEAAQKQGQEFKIENIIYIDDRASHVEGMRSVFSARPENIYNFQFIKSLDWIDSFLNGPKLKAQETWCSFADSLKARANLPSYRPCHTMGIDKSVYSKYF